MRLRRKTISTSVRAILGLSIGLLLIHLILEFTHTDLRRVLSHAEFSSVSVAVFLHGVVLVLLAWRWALLLSGQGVRIGFAEALRYTLIGAFFNLLIPGPVTGDLAKAALVWEPSRGRGAEAAVTVFLDRLVGISVLAILSSGALVLWIVRPYASADFGPTLLGGEGLVSDAALRIALPTIVFVVLAAIVWPAIYVVGVPILYCLVPKKLKPLVEKVVHSLGSFRSNRRRILQTTALTLVAHLLLVVVLYLVGTSVLTPPPRFSDCFIAHQVGAVFSIVPLTPGGLGVRDVGVTLALEVANPGLRDTAAVAVVATGIIVFWRLVGGLVFLATVLRRSHRAAGVEASLSDSG